MADDYLNRLKDYSKAILRKTPARSAAEPADARNRQKWLEEVENGETGESYSDWLKRMKGK